MTDLWRLSAADLAALVRRRDVSAREAARSALDRLDAVNPAVNAVVDHRPAEVLAEAEALDARLGRGEDPGPLAGVPVTVKVNIDQRGFPTTNGVRLQRDLVAETNSPVVDNLRRSGAVILGRTNTPAFSLRWFTDNRLHGATRNPRDPSRTPGGSSGGAAAATAVGIGHIAHGTDIAGSIRYPAYACGVHGLRPSLGRVAAYNATAPERVVSGQITAVSGPIARTIGDLRLGLAALARPDARDPWWVPAPLDGPEVPRRAALCVRPDGLATVPEVEAALRDAARRLVAAGWSVEEVEAPPLREAAELQTRLWLGDGFGGLLAAAEREGDPGALSLLRHHRAAAEAIAPDFLSGLLVRRATLVRQWQLFLDRFAVLLLPVSAELPVPDGLDMTGTAAFDALWEAQMPQVGLPLLGLPALTVATGLGEIAGTRPRDLAPLQGEAKQDGVGLPLPSGSVGAVPVGVQIVAARYREDLCFLAGEAVEAGGTPPSPVDPA